MTLYHPASAIRAALLRSGIALLFSFLVTYPQRVSAQVFTWSGAAGNNDWFTAGNWFGGVPSGGSERRIMNANIQISNPALGAASGGSLWLGGIGPGGSSTATITLTNGTGLSSSFAYLGANSGSHGTLTVSGAGSGWVNTSQMYVGISSGRGTVVVEGGAYVVTNQTFIGYAAQGAVTVTGAGSLWVNDSYFAVGAEGGSGVLTVENGGTARAGNTGNGYLSFGFNGRGGTGVLNIGTGGAAGNLQALGVNVGGSGGTVNFNHNQAAYTFSPLLIGPLSIEQKGSGTSSLTAANTYSGGTIVSAGTLMVNNVTGSGLGTGSVSVSAGGRLGGIGAFTGAAEIGGVYAPGNSVGKLTSGSLSYTVTGTYEWQINGATGLGGRTSDGWDLAIINGALSFEAGAKLAISSLGSDNLSGSTMNFDDAANYSWTIATTTGGITGWENLTLDLAGFENTYTGSFALAVSGNNLQLQYSAVPEPSTLALALIGSLAVTGMRRRRSARVSA